MTIADKRRLVWTHMKVKLSIFWFVLSLYLSTATCFCCRICTHSTRLNITVALVTSKVEEAVAT